MSERTLRTYLYDRNVRFTNYDMHNTFYIFAETAVMQYNKTNYTQGGNSKCYMTSL